MIPHVIHYFWFGGKPLPKTASYCIGTWRKFLPDYEIKEWNESNFDVNIIPFTEQAYKEKKYAFVSDYARLWVLYNFGGLYLDVDVEIIQSPLEIIERGAFMGTEKSVERNNDLFIAAGSLFGVEAKNCLLKNVMDFYESNPFKEITINEIFTNAFVSSGWRRENKITSVGAFLIYPVSYFSPVDWKTRKIRKSKDTFCIHWFGGSWVKMGFFDKLKRYLFYLVPDFILISYYNLKFRGKCRGCIK